MLEAQTATSAGTAVAALFDLAGDMGKDLARKRRADTTVHEVCTAIRTSSLPAATQRELESRFVIAYEGLTDEIDPADLSGDDGGGEKDACAED